MSGGNRLVNIAAGRFPAADKLMILFCFRKKVAPRRGPAQPNHLKHLTESGTQNLPAYSQAFPAESVPPDRPDVLCVECGQGPRAGGGTNCCLDRTPSYAVALRSPQPRTEQGSV